MEGIKSEINSLSKVLRYDGSYFYIIELGKTNGLYKYIMADWQGKILGKPIMFYSHTKRSNLSVIDKNYFDNNLINKKRLNKYLKNNLYIGGIKKINNQPIKEVKEGMLIKPNYEVYLRNNNYILIEKISSGEINKYNIYEFIRSNVIDFFETLNLYSEKDLLNLKDDTDYVINNLLNQKRVLDKKKNANGYLGTVNKINGIYRKVYSTDNEKSVLNLK